MTNHVPRLPAINLKFSIGNVAGASQASRIAAKHKKHASQLIRGTRKTASACPSQNTAQRWKSATNQSFGPGTTALA